MPSLPQDLLSSNADTLAMAGPASMAGRKDLHRVNLASLLSASAAQSQHTLGDVKRFSAPPGLSYREQWCPKHAILHRNLAPSIFVIELLIPSCCVWVGHTRAPHRERWPAMPRATSAEAETKPEA